MTREDAIEFGNMWLEANEDCKDLDVDDRNTYKFFQIAIKALEQEPFINKPCVSSGVCEYDKNKVLDKLDEIITDALDKSTDQKESQTLRWVLDKISEVQND